LSLKQQTAILEKKLTQLEDWIIEIPNGYDEFAREWREKLAKWWRLYAESGVESGTAATKPPISSLEAEENGLMFDDDSMLVCPSTKGPFSGTGGNTSGHYPMYDPIEETQLTQLSK